MDVWVGSVVLELAMIRMKSGVLMTLVESWRSRRMASVLRGKFQGLGEVGTWGDLSEKRVGLRRLDIFTTTQARNLTALNTLAAFALRGLLKAGLTGVVKIFELVVKTFPGPVRCCRTSRQTLLLLAHVLVGGTQIRSGAKRLVAEPEPRVTEKEPPGQFYNIVSRFHQFDSRLSQDYVSDDTVLQSTDY